MTQTAPVPIPLAAADCLSTTRENTRGIVNFVIFASADPATHRRKSFVQ